VRSGYIILKQRFWTRSISLACALDKPGCHTGQAYSRTDRIIEI